MCYFPRAVALRQLHQGLPHSVLRPLLRGSSASWTFMCSLCGATHMGTRIHTHVHVHMHTGASSAPPPPAGESHSASQSPPTTPMPLPYVPPPSPPPLAGELSVVAFMEQYASTYDLSVPLTCGTRLHAPLVTPILTSSPLSMTGWVITLHSVWLDIYTRRPVRAVIGSLEKMQQSGRASLSCTKLTSKDGTSVLWSVTACLDGHCATIENASKIDARQQAATIVVRAAGTTAPPPKTSPSPPPPSPSPLTHHPHPHPYPLRNCLSDCLRGLTQFPSQSRWDPPALGPMWPSCSPALGPMWPSCSPALGPM